MTEAAASGGATPEGSAEAETNPEGQRLVKLRRGPGRPRKNPPPEPTAPTLERPKLAGEEEAFTADEELPPDEPDPVRRNKPSIGRIELTVEGKRALAEERGEPLEAPDPGELPDFSDNVMRTLDDLMASFPIGYPESNYYIHVDRKQPTAYAGAATKGTLRPITKQLTLEGFKAEYGGGVYDLIVYGPPARGRILDEGSGLPRPRALTKPVRITIPWHGDGGYPPNPSAAYENEEEQEEAEMANGSGIGIPREFLARGVTPASAKIFETHTRHEETMDERDRRERHAARASDVSAAEKALRIVSEQNARERQEYRETIRRLEQKLEERDKDKGTDIEGIAKLMGTMNPRAGAGELQTVRDAHARELEAIERRHKDELDTLRRQNADERERLMATNRSEIERMEQRLQSIESRSDERVKSVEGRIDTLTSQHKDELSRTKSELKSDHSREVESLKNEHARQMEAQRATFQMQLDSERRSNERDIATSKEIANGQLQTEKTRLEMELSSAKAEIRRRDRDVEELKKAAEKHKDLGRMLEEAEKTAALLGFKKDDGDAGEPRELDWKTILMGAVAEGAKRLPEILKSAGDTVGAIRGAPRPQQQPMLPMAQGPGNMMPMAQAQAVPGYSTFPTQPRTFATENSPGPESMPVFMDQPAPGVRPEPLPTHPQEQQPVQAMPPMPPQMAQAQAPVPMDAASFPPMPGQAPAQMAPPVRSASRPPGPTAAPSMPPPQSEEPPVDPALDQMILGGREQIETAFVNQVSPADIARGLVAQYGKPQVTMFLPAFKTETVVGAFARAGIQTRLSSRKGQRYLREIDKAVRQELEKA